MLRKHGVVGSSPITSTNRRKRCVFVFIDVSNVYVRFKEINI